MSNQQREEKQSRASSFSHKALAQAVASTKGIPSIANTLRAISAMPPRMRYTLAARPWQGATRPPAMLGQGQLAWEGRAALAACRARWPGQRPPTCW